MANDDDDDDDDDDGACPVCTIAQFPQERLGCGHTLCRLCLIKWTSATCPTCRADIARERTVLVSAILGADWPVPGSARPAQNFVHYRLRVPRALVSLVACMASLVPDIFQLVFFLTCAVIRVTVIVWVIRSPHLQQWLADMGAFTVTMRAHEARRETHECYADPASDACETLRIEHAQLVCDIIRRAVDAMLAFVADNVHAIIDAALQYMV